MGDLFDQIPDIDRELAGEYFAALQAEAQLETEENRQKVKKIEGDIRKGVEKAQLDREKEEQRIKEKAIDQRQAQQRINVSGLSARTAADRLALTKEKEEKKTGFTSTQETILSRAFPQDELKDLAEQIDKIGVNEVIRNNADPEEIAAIKDAFGISAKEKAAQKEKEKKEKEGRQFLDEDYITDQFSFDDLEEEASKKAEEEGGWFGSDEDVKTATEKKFEKLKKEEIEKMMKQIEDLRKEGYTDVEINKMI